MSYFNGLIEKFGSLPVDHSARLRQKLIGHWPAPNPRPPMWPGKGGGW